MKLITEISPKDDMFLGNLEHYFHVGISAMECIKAGLAAAGKDASQVKRILDLPCGYGRVLRHLRLAFPEAEITACDLEKDGVDFCANHFQAVPVYSDVDISKINIQGTFDLIWVGSLFTHIDNKARREFLNFFSQLLSPDGLLLITVHGVEIEKKILSGENTYGLTPEQHKSLLQQFHKERQGYVNYTGQQGYGISIATPEFYRHEFGATPGLNVVLYKEKAWDNHQDMMCCQKVDIADWQGKLEDPLTSLMQNLDSNYPTEDQLSQKRVIFSLPEGFTIGGVTSWSIELSNRLEEAGYTTFLGNHPSRYNNPVVDFELARDGMVLDCMHLPHPDDPTADAIEYFQQYKKGLPAVFIPSWSWGTYALAALMASRYPNAVRVIGIAHADESGYYQWLVHYESIIHKFIAVSPEIEMRLARLLPHRKQDILVQPYPVRSPDELSREYASGSEPLRLVYAGRIAQYQKQVFKLLDLASALEKEGVNFAFRIIGGGSEKEEFDRRVSELPANVRARIQMENALPLAKMPEVWRTSDINILVSTFEGTSVSMLESMGEGCVPVMTAVSGTSAVIDSGENGITVPVDALEEMVQAIKRLDQNRDQLRVLGTNAYNKIKASYSFDQYLPWFEDLVREVWSEQPRPWPPVVPPLEFLDIHNKYMAMTEGKSQAVEHREKKKALFISHDANWGGAPKVICSLIKGMDRSKWEPVVVLPSHGNLEEFFASVNVRTKIFELRLATTNLNHSPDQFTAYTAGLRQRVGAIAEFILKEGIQLVVTNTICNYEGALAAKLAGVPHIWYVHEIASRDVKLTPILDFAPFYGSLDALSEKIIVISKAVQNEILQFHRTTKTELIYTGIEDEFDSVASQKSAVIGVESDTPVISYIGILSKRKGVLNLVNVAEIVVKKHPSAMFVLAGSNDDDCMQQLEAQIAEKGLQKNFLFLGFRHDVTKILSASDAVLVPSLVEPFSLVTIEAMASGKPVIATRSGGPEEIILDGVTGYLTPINGCYEMALAVNRLLDDPELRKSMGAAGRQRFVDMYKYEGFLANFTCLLESVLENAATQDSIIRTLEVERMINLLTVAAEARVQLAKLKKNEHPYDEVNQMLSYPGYLPFTVEKIAEEPRAKVSVCIPVYNGEKYLKQCILSILNQTFGDFELIVVNDKSTDGSASIVKSFNDPRIKYFENKNNLGLVGNWNRCIELSSGAFICIFHQDDIMEPENLEKKFRVLSANPKVGFVYSDTSVIGANGEITGEHWFNAISPNVDFLRPSRYFFDLLFSDLNIVSCPSVMARREVYERLGGFDSRLPLTVDMEMWLRISLFYDVAYLSEPLIRYRWHGSNATNHYLALDLIHIYLCKQMVLDKYPEVFADTGYSEKLIAAITTKVIDRSMHHYVIKDYRVAKQYLYFLQTIRQNIRVETVEDFQIAELMKCVDQANALQWASVLSR